MRILLADDEPPIRDTMTRLLQRAGHEVTTAEDGTEALDQLATGAFDLLITDLHMPEMDGITLTRRLAKLTTKPRILVISGDDTLFGMAQALGANATLPKPFASEDLLAAISRAME